MPLAIHLWNRRPGREVAVGSLRWLAAGANRRMRNLRLEQVLLLLLRAALLAVLAVAVAGPTWRHALPPGRGQVLVSPELMGTSSLAAVRPSIDALRRRGYALRWLSQGLPKVSAAAWQADSLGRRTDSVSALSQAAASGFYWERIRQAADTFAGQPLYVLTPATLRGMQGTHRPLPSNLTWQTLPLPTASTWVQAANGTADSLRLLVGYGTEQQTTFRTVRVARPAAGQKLTGPALPPLRYETPRNGQAQVLPLPATPADSGRAPAAVLVQPAALRVWVYTTPAYAEDARYLRAALRAASAGLPGSLALTVAPTLPTAANAPDWLFWLSAAPVPEIWRGQVRQGLHLWQAAAGPGEADTTGLLAPALDEAAPVTIWRHTQQPAGANADVLWTDGRGRAVLARQPVGQGAFYQFSTRLNPAWSELPDSPALPALLLSLLQPDPTGPTLARLNAHDQRRLGPAQRPVRAGQGGRKLLAPTAFRLLDLRPWVVLAAGLLLALERWLAHRRAALTLPSLA